jgi:hypothetical protein
MGVSGERISPDFALCTPRPPCLLPSLAAPLPFAEYVGGLFENAPFWLRCNGLCSPFLQNLPPLVARPASMVTHSPPCLNGLTSARRASMVSHLPPCLNGYTSARRASMVSHLPPRLNGYTSARRASMVTHLPAMPQWSHNTLHTSRVDQLPRHHIRTPKAAFLRSRCSPWDLLRASRVSSSSEPRSAVVPSCADKIRCVWQSATHIEDVARLTI